MHSALQWRTIFKHRSLLINFVLLWHKNLSFWIKKTLKMEKEKEFLNNVSFQKHWKMLGNCNTIKIGVLVQRAFWYKAYTELVLCSKTALGSLAIVWVWGHDCRPRPCPRFTLPIFYFKSTPNETKILPPTKTIYLVQKGEECNKTSCLKSLFSSTYYESAREASSQGSHEAISGHARSQGVRLKDRFTFRWQSTVFRYFLRGSEKGRVTTKAGKLEIQPKSTLIKHLHQWVTKLPLT